METNHKYGTYNVTKMMGIWYEYLVTPDLKTEAREGGYDCATWLMMQDKKDERHFNVIYNTMQLETNKSDITNFMMDCDSTKYVTNVAYCNYAKTHAPNLLASLTTHKPREFKII